MAGIESMMNRDVVTVDRTTKVDDAARRMRDRNLGALLVVDGGKLCGVFSERDLMNRVVAEGKDPSSMTVEQVFTANPKSVTAQTSVEDCYQLLRQESFRHLPILNEQQEPVGIVSARDFFRCLVIQALEPDINMSDACAKLGQMTQLMACMEELR